MSEFETCLDNDSIFFYYLTLNIHIVPSEVRHRLRLRYREAPPVCCPGPGAPPLRVTKYGSDGPSLARSVLQY